MHQFRLIQLSLQQDFRLPASLSRPGIPPYPSCRIFVVQYHREHILLNGCEREQFSSESCLNTDWPIFGDCGTNVLENKDPQESQNLVISMDIVTVPCKFRKVALLRASLLGASMGTLLSTIFQKTIRLSSVQVPSVAFNVQPRCGA